MSFAFLLFVKRMTNAPTPTSIGAKDAGFRSLSIILSFPISPRRRICAVTVLPTFAPNITGMACATFMIPAFTKPTSMMVVAAELWIIPVTPVPNAHPLMSPTPFFLLVVTVSRIRSRPEPASFSIDELIWLIPKRKRPTPPSNCNIAKISI